ncbi:MAG: BBE domain-containing protein [Candidatus Limnocylindrales bacterium]
MAAASGPEHAYPLRHAQLLEGALRSRDDTRPCRRDRGGRSRFGRRRGRDPGRAHPRRRAPHPGGVGRLRGPSRGRQRHSPWHLDRPSVRRAQRGLGAGGGGLVRALLALGRWLPELRRDDQSAARVAAAFAPETFDRLRQIKRRVDPTNRFRFNANIPPA